jgi:hypothetical protein
MRVQHVHLLSCFAVHLCKVLLKRCAGFAGQAGCCRQMATLTLGSMWWAGQSEVPLASSVRAGLHSDSKCNIVVNFFTSRPSSASFLPKFEIFPGTNLVDAEETTSSIVEDSPDLPKMKPGAAGHSTLSDALHYRNVQVIILLHTLASRFVPTAQLHLLWG